MYSVLEKYFFTPSTIPAKPNELWKNLAIHIVLAAACFSIYCLWFKTPLVAEDHIYLWHSLQEYFSYWSLDQVVSKTPFQALILFILLKLNFLQAGFYFYFLLLFTLHAAGIFLTATKILEMAGIGIPERIFPKYIFSFALVVFCFHPNLLELLLMPSAATYATGALWMGISFWQKKRMWIFLFSLLAFATYETYFLPLLLFALISITERNNPQQPFDWSGTRILPVSLAFISCIAIKFLVGLKTGLYFEPVSIDFLHNFLRVLSYHTEIFTIGFDSKISSWIENSILIIAIILLMYKQDYKSIRLALLCFAIGILSSIFDLFIPYDGIRIVYGGLIFKMAAILILFNGLLSKLTAFISLSFLLILTVVYSNNLLSIYKIRLQSLKNQQRIERLISGVMQISEPSNTMLVPPFNLHAQADDWQLEPNSTIQYNLFSKLQERDKKMNFRVVGIDKSPFAKEDFPIFYPARAFTSHYAPNWKDDEYSKTGQVFTIDKGFIGVAVWGPYIELDSGNYKVDITMKLNPNPSDFPEFGKLSGCMNIGKTWFFGLPFVRNDFKPGKFKTISAEFRLNEPHKDVEFVIESNGKSSFSVDFLRITKL